MLVQYVTDAVVTSRAPNIAELANEPTKIILLNEVNDINKKKLINLSIKNLRDENSIGCQETMDTKFC